MVERRVADTILQSEFKVEIGGRNFRVAPPTNATIIRLSEMVVNLPDIETDNALEEVLKNGRKARVLGDIIALLICGEIAPLRIYNLGSIFSHFKRGRRFRKVRRAILYKTSPTETLITLSEILKRQEIGDFFHLIASLKSANILKKTRETTQYGQQSKAQH